MKREEVEALREVLGGFPRERRYLLRVLQVVQETLGYLPEEALREVALHFGLQEVEVYGVATFYNQFRYVPKGKYHVVVCMGTACHSMGGGLVLEAFERELGIKVGEVTEDGFFSLERVGCIGCCTQAPVVVINDPIFPKMSPSKVEEVLVRVKGHGLGDGKK